MDTARVEALQLAREAVGDAGVPVARPVLGRDGERTVIAAGSVVEVERFVGSDSKMDSLDRIRLAMPTFARLHDALRATSLPVAADELRFANHVPADDLLARTAEGATRLRRLGPAALHRLAAHLDDPDAVRAHLEGHDQAFDLAETILRDLARWRRSFEA